MDTKVKIKKYANRRLYDMSQSRYINISDIADMVRSGQDIEVKDAKTGDDLTAATLLQLFLDLENEGQGILTGKTLIAILSAESKQGQKTLNKHLYDQLSDEETKGLANLALARRKKSMAVDEPALNKELVELRTAFSQFTKAFRKFDDKG